MTKSRVFFPLLIFFIWLATYLACLLLLNHKLEWDESKYLSCARGIAENFDFSSRATTILGLIKYGFPQHTHHYPLHSLYIAVFFKLFGVSVKTAYFSSWFAALITCLFIYFTSLLLTENNKTISFLVSIFFLYFPKVIVYCNSAMMEIPSCALLSVLMFFVVKQAKTGNINPILLGISALLLYLFKSLFIGMFFAFLVLVSWRKDQQSIFLRVALYLGAFFGLYFICSKFVFLSLAPWMNVLPAHEGIDGSYADFVGGFFNNISDNLILNMKLFLEKIFLHYYPFFAYSFLPEDGVFYPIIPYWFELAIYFIMLFYVLFFSLCDWRKLLPVQKTLISITLISVFVFNLAYILIMGATGVGLMYRYNLVYLPLLLMSLGIVLFLGFNLFENIILRNKKKIYFLLLTFVLLVYIPIYFSADLLITSKTKEQIEPSQSLKKLISGSNPMFVYFPRGVNISWDLFPTREIFMEASNDQIIKLNSILPKPIEFLFLTTSCHLFKQNQGLILEKRPIINNWYTFYGIDSLNQIAVYRYKRIIN